MTIVKACIESKYRKAVNLAFWNLIATCHHYDEYGEGVAGIVRFLEEQGVQLLRVGRTAALDAELRLYVYLPDVGNIVGILEEYRKRRKVIDIFGKLLAIATWHVAERGVDPEVFRKMVDIIIDNSDVLNLIVENLEKDVDPLALEEEAKARMLANDWSAGKALTIALAVKVLPFLDVDRFAEMMRVSIGMALSVAHEAAIIAAVGNRFRPGDEEKLRKLVLAENVENKITRLLRFALYYLEAASELEEVYDAGDYDNISVHIGPGKIYMKLGAHHAEVSVRGSSYVVKYMDHNSDRQRAVEEFFRRLGYSINNGIIVPFERAKEAARAIAATTSADIQGCIWIFNKASSVEELLMLRRECSDDDEYDDDD